MAQEIPRGYGSQCQGGAGVRGFSWSGKPRLLLSLIPVGRSFPTRPSFFTMIDWAEVSVAKFCTFFFTGMNFDIRYSFFATSFYIKKWHAKSERL